MTNHLIAVALTDGEIFSNLKFTQRLYDALLAQDALHPPDPVDVPTALATSRTLLSDLLREDGIVVEQVVAMDDLQTLLKEIQAADGSQVRQQLQVAFNDSRAYHERWIARSRRR
jgi:CRISPR-associated protein Csc2